MASCTTVETMLMSFCLAYILARNVDSQIITEEDTFLWLTKGDLKAETESEIVAAQDQALQMKYSGPSSYDRLDIRTTWVTSLELRPAWRS
jgi:hypothetical protein